MGKAFQTHVKDNSNPGKGMDNILVMRVVLGFCFLVDDFTRVAYCNCHA
jgi:hypothetical protein